MEIFEVLCVKNGDRSTIFQQHCILFWINFFYSSFNGLCLPLDITNDEFICIYNIIVTWWRLKSPTIWLFVDKLVQGNMRITGPLWGESIGHWPSQRGQ